MSGATSVLPAPTSVLEELDPPELPEFELLPQAAIASDATIADAAMLVRFGFMVMARMLACLITHDVAEP
jgi:hypothetical protein